MRRAISSGSIFFTRWISISGEEDFKWYIQKFLAPQELTDSFLRLWIKDTLQLGLPLSSFPEGVN
jgi:hypothetical protein